MNPEDVARQAKALGRLDDMGGWDGWVALAEYLTELADSMGEAIELDIIAFCCEYSHYDSREELKEDLQKDSIEDIEDQIVAEFDGGIIVHAF
jgi:hypothetical protein